MNVTEKVAAIEDFVKELLSEEDNARDYDYDTLKKFNKDYHDELVDYFVTGKQSSAIEHGLAQFILSCFCTIEYCHKHKHEDHIDDVEEKLRELVEKEGTRKVSNEPKKSLAKRVVSTLADDGVEIAYRQGARQLAKTVQEPLVNFLIHQFQLDDSSSMRAKITGFLATDVGFGVISLLCSVGVGALPLPGFTKEVTNELSRQLRLQGEMNVAEPIVQLLMEPLRNILTERLMTLQLPGAVPQQLTEQKTMPAEILIGEPVPEPVAARVRRSRKKADAEASK